MSYIKDSDLEFLKECNSTDLNDLVYCLTHDPKDNETRWSEELTSRDRYKKYYPDHSKYWEDIAGEIQCFGANSFATMFRLGKGILYREVLTDVCQEMMSKFKDRGQPIEDIEDALLIEIFGKALSQMSEEDIKKLGISFNINNISKLTSSTLLALAQTIFKLGGFRSYQLTLIIANSVSNALFARGLTFAGNAALTRSVGLLAGPIGWGITGLLTAIDLAGPAYRVTFPAVIYVALLRKKYNLSVEEKQRAIFEEFDIDDL